MSEKHDDHASSGDAHDYGGGHEIDRMPNNRLFNLLFGLSALTLLSGLGVIQLFNIQVEALEDARAQQGSFRLQAYLEEMQKAKTSSGKVTVNELDDKATVNTRHFMPIAAARKSVLDDPNKLKAFGTFPGWKTSDDQAPAAAAPAPGVPVDGARPQPGRGEAPGQPPAGKPNP